MIDNEKLIYLLKKNFAQVMYADEDYYRDYKVIITMEQQSIDDAERNEIYIVLKTMPATLTHAQTIMPVTISAISEFNNIDVCKRLLTQFAERFNLEMNEEKTIKQYYTAPSTISVFNKVFDGYRALFYLTGTFVISETANYFDAYFNGEKIDAIDQVLDGTIQLDTQATYSTNNFTKSTGKVATLILSLSCYLTENDLANKCLAIMLKDIDKEPLGIDTPFIFDIKYKNGLTLTDTFKLSKMVSQQAINNVPVVTFVFTN